MTIRHMKIFVAVCRQGSVTGAAQALYLAQPSVSLAIRELEEYYGVRLFDRISRRMQLTQEGRQMFSYASHIVSLFDEMEQSIKNWDSLGTLPGWVQHHHRELFNAQAYRAFLPQPPGHEGGSTHRQLGGD